MEVYLLRQDIAAIFLPDLGVQNSLDAGEVTDVREINKEESHAREEVQHYRN
jgi:hypothetical protein